MKLGEKIKLVRKQRGMTQRELGERLHLDGNAANRIAQYESGFRTPKEGRIQEIARVLNVRKENFFTSAETQEDKNSLKRQVSTSFFLHYGKSGNDLVTLTPK